MTRVQPWTVDLRQPVDRSLRGQLGGKAANLALLVESGAPIPPAVCVTAAAFRAQIDTIAGLEPLYAALDAAGSELAGAAPAAAALRDKIREAPVRDDIRDAIVTAWGSLDPTQAFAVRSSATAEDLPDASFAGQHDTILNVSGAEAVLNAVRACWASLYTDRAVLYRGRNGYSHRDVALAAVIQELVAADVSGVAFTADPMRGDRRWITVEAVPGLGEGLVSGVVPPDAFRIERGSGRVLERRIARKLFAIRAAVDGAGTAQVAIARASQSDPTLDDDAAVRIAQMTERIESRFGAPQDIEWCIDGEALYVLQARPITTAYPLPSRAGTGDGPRVYVSFNHVQVMMAAITPFGLSVMRHMPPFARDPVTHESRVFVPAAGHLFLDPTEVLERRGARSRFLAVAAKIEPRIAAATQQACARLDEGDGERVPSYSATTLLARALPIVVPVLARLANNLMFTRPEGRLRALQSASEAALAREISYIESAGNLVERLDRAGELLSRMLLQHALPLMPVIPAASIARMALRKLAPTAAPDDFEALMRGLPGNVTTEMGLELADLADRAREVGPVADALRDSAPGEVRGRLQALGEPAKAFLAEFDGFVARYGTRGPGEIDAGQRRWRDDPSALFQMISGNLRGTGTAVGAHRAQHARLAVEADAAAARIVDHAGRGALGFIRRALARRFVRVVRNLAGGRELPKFILLKAFDAARRSALAAGESLVAQRKINRADDVVFLSLHEIRVALESNEPLHAQIAERRADHARNERRIPPRAMTSDGAIYQGNAGTFVPTNGKQLAGLAVSSGVVDGIARVVLDPARTALHSGEILVAPFTDPGWTPLFMHAAGLAMEVGGAMTHGSVIAREYGIPAVVSVDDATKLIHTGDRIRVDAERGVVEILASRET